MVENRERYVYSNAKRTMCLLINLFKEIFLSDNYEHCWFKYYFSSTQINIVNIKQPLLIYIITTYQFFFNLHN